MKIDQLIETSFEKWIKNLSYTVPFIIQSLAILGFTTVLVSIGFTQTIDMEMVNLVLSSSPFIISSFLLLILFSSYMEAVGLGSINAIIKNKKPGWHYGRKFWWKIFETTIISIVLYILISIPSLILFSLFPISITGVYYLGFSIVFMSLLLFYSKYILISTDKSPIYSIKRSIKLFIKKPGTTLKVAAVLMIVNTPIFLVSLFYSVIGTFLIGLFTQTWSAFFMFLVYEKL